MSESTADLVCRAADPNLPLPERHRAFDRLTARYARVALGLAAAHTADRTLAEDIAQAALIAAWISLPTLRAPAAFPRWLALLVRTQASRARRRADESVPLERLDACAGPDLFDRYEDAQALRDALSSLSPTEQTCLILFHGDGYGREEIAALTGLSPTTVKKRLASARKTLRRTEHPWKEALSMETASLAARVAAFTRLFSGHVERGVSLVRCLKLLEEQSDNRDFAEAIRQICTEILAGGMLSRAMAKHPRYFSPAYIRAVRRGEICGRLEVSLRQLADGQTEGEEALPDAPEMERVYIAIASATGGHLPWSWRHLLFGLASAPCEAQSALPDSGALARRLTPLTPVRRDTVASIDREATAIARQRGRGEVDSLDYLEALRRRPLAARWIAGAGSRRPSP